MNSSLTQNVHAKQLFKHVSISQLSKKIGLGLRRKKGKSYMAK